MLPFLSTCGLLTVSERTIWTRCKAVMSFLKSPIDDLRNFYSFSNRNRDFRRILLDSSQSATLSRSVKFKSAIAWNGLPRSITIADDFGNLVATPIFKNDVYNYLVSLRTSSYADPLAVSTRY